MSKFEKNRTSSFFIIDVNAIYDYLYFKTKMGVAGLMFEPHPPNFEIYTTFKDVQMMLKHFFDISTGFRSKKNGKEFSVHLLRCPWFGLHIYIHTQKKLLYFVDKLSAEL